MGHNVGVDFARGASSITFTVIDATTGNVVKTSAASPVGGAAFNLTGQLLYELDFSDVTTQGWYRLQVAGVGVSHVFQISDRVYDQVALAAQRGAYHARCGCALTSNLTRFTRSPCHTSDGTIMPTNPL